MPSPRPELQLEGQWEDILQRAHDLEGRRVRVTVLADEPRPEDLREAWRQWFAEGETIQPEPPPARSSSDPFEAAFGSAVEDKFRRQGLRIP